MPRGKTEAAASKVKTATALGALGGSIAGPIGASVGAITGLIIGDDKTVFPIDMIAIPAYQAYLVNGTPALTVYIKAGETLVPTGGNVLDMQENMDIDTAPMTEKPKKRKLSAWNRYVKKKSNQIRFKSGKNKGKLDLKKMAKAGGFGKKKGRKK
ncbi:MAG: hypothetical protein CL525_00430 [Aequorivita sp.]|nr:hypothetical protein [Aequorivita sp.]